METRHTRTTLHKVFRSVLLTEDNFAAQSKKQNEFPIRGAALCLPIIDNSEIVLVERTIPPNIGWSLPGGRVAKDEEFEVAAIRELEEETSIVANNPPIRLLEEITEFHSASGQSISINVVTFLVLLSGNALEAQVEADLPVGRFSLNQLPSEMLNLDRAKVHSFLERMDG